MYALVARPQYLRLVPLPSLRQLLPQPRPAEPDAEDRLPHPGAFRPRGADRSGGPEGAGPHRSRLREGEAHGDRALKRLRPPLGRRPPHVSAPPAPVRRARGGRRHPDQPADAQPRHADRGARPAGDPRLPRPGRGGYGFLVATAGGTTRVRNASDEASAAATSARRSAGIDRATTAGPPAVP